MAGKKQCSGRTQQATRHAPEAFTDNAPDGREADDRRRGHRPVRLIQIQIIGNRKRKAHGDAVAQRVTPLRPCRFYPRRIAPGESSQVHHRDPMATVQVVPETRVMSFGSCSNSTRTGTR